MPKPSATTILVDSANLSKFILAAAEEEILRLVSSVATFRIIC